MGNQKCKGSSWGLSQNGNRNIETNTYLGSGPDGAGRTEGAQGSDIFPPAKTFGGPENDLRPGPPRPDRPPHGKPAGREPQDVMAIFPKAVGWVTLAVKGQALAATRVTSLPVPLAGHVGKR